MDEPLARKRGQRLAAYRQCWTDLGVDVARGRRASWSDASGIQFRLATASVPPGVWDGVKASAVTAGLKRGKADTRGKDRRWYGPGGDRRAFGVSAFAEGTRPTVAIFPAFDSATDADEADLVAGFAAQLCDRLAPPIARSFSFACGNGNILPEETSGPLLWIDWWQYLGAAIVEAVGRSQLLALDVFEVEAGPYGGVFVRATRSPNEPFNRRPLAAQLGISLKPLREWHPDTQTWSEREWPW